MSRSSTSTSAIRIAALTTMAGLISAGLVGTAAARPDGEGSGNNGTFKVDGVEFDDGMGNEPHAACGFRLRFFGFDADQHGTIDIDGQAPSGAGRVGGRADVLLGDDAAGGANDVDAVYVFSSADLDLTGLQPHAKQGYHLKVTVSTGEAGGVKHKVFWLQPCAPGGGGGGLPE